MTCFPVPNSATIKVLYVVGDESTAVGINVAHIKEISNTQRCHTHQGEIEYKAAKVMYSVLDIKRRA